MNSFFAWWCLHAFRVTATAGKAQELKQCSQFRIVSKSHKCHMWLQISHLITLSHTLYLPDQPRQADLQGWFIPKRARGHRFYSWLCSETSLKSLFSHYPHSPAAVGGQHLLGPKTWVTALKQDTHRHASLQDPLGRRSLCGWWIFHGYHASDLKWQHVTWGNNSKSSAPLSHD